MSSYTVAPGDSMWKIANDHGLALDALIAANPQVADPSVIEVDQVLNLPGDPAPPAAAAVPPPEATRGGVAPYGSYQQQPYQFQGGPGFKTVGYFTNWGIYGRNYQPQDIPAQHLTHILYSFANVRSDTGEVHLTDTYADLEKHYPSDSWEDSGNNAYGCIKQLFLLKKQHRHFHVLLSIGGWTYSANFPAPASSPQGRQNFAQSAVKLVADLGFDGIDIDWEYPQDAEQAYNFVLLLHETRRALDNFSATYLQGKRLLLTVAAPCGEVNYSKLRIGEMDQFLDFWNLMCYDFAGSWDAKAGHMANIYASPDMPDITPFNADSAIRAYIAGGVRPDKLICGLPLYGRAFEQTQGPGRSFQGVGEGSWENGVWDYKALPHAGAEEYNDERLIASWSYSAGDGKMVSYDTPLITTRKVDYIRSGGLGGAMWWELSGDHPVSNERSLVKVTVDALGGLGAVERVENNLYYPTSVFDNVRNGFA